MAPRDMVGEADLPLESRDFEMSEMFASAAYTLELFHVADQEAGPAAIETIPNFSAVLNALRAQDVAIDTLTLSSGDAYIPGVFFEASSSIFGVPGVADIVVQNLLGIEAVAFGNHEFDRGTALIRQLITGEGIDGFDGTAFPYLSANLDFSGTRTSPTSWWRTAGPRCRTQSPRAR
jgi:2',3'-cyclic-nucleotide 2'-phosphodiesterase (5'-nucleotidase family)